jgi:hypothetical protein
MLLLAQLVADKPASLPRVLKALFLQGPPQFGRSHSCEKIVLTFGHAKSTIELLLVDRH